MDDGERRLWMAGLLIVLITGVAIGVTLVSHYNKYNKCPDIEVVP